MKIAVITDIHSNFIALQTVSEHIEQWRPDTVIMAGDLVNRGPCPLECLNFALERQISRDWIFIRGNHEDYVIEQSKPDARNSFPAAEVHRASIWTYNKQNFDTTEIARMPFKQDILDPEGKLLRFVHASMVGNRDGIYPETTNNDLFRKIGSPPDSRAQTLIVFCAGHTHRPLIRDLKGITIVNAGSVGLPFDGDRRACYAQLTWKRGSWHAEIVRLNYDLQSAEDDFYTTGYLEGGGPLVEIVMVEFKTATSQLYNWSFQFQKAALAGKISMRESVDLYLSQFS